MNWNDITYWNKQSYGSAKRIKRKTLISLLIILCICTVGTNFLIPIIPKIVKNDLVVRYE